MPKERWFLCGVLFFSGCSIAQLWQRPRDYMICPVTTIDDVVQLFPKTPEQIKQRVAQVKIDVTNKVQQIIHIPDQQRTFDNTIQALDDAMRLIKQIDSSIEILNQTSPRDDVRQAAYEVLLDSSEFIQTTITKNKPLFDAVRAYEQGNAKTEKLDDEQRYYVQEIIRNYIRDGMLLSAEQLALAKRLSNEITQLSLAFEKNISDVDTKIPFTCDDLAGVPEPVVAGLKTDEQGRFLVGLDYPTVFGIMRHARNESVRKQVFETFSNRAYPENYELLAQIMRKRDELAKVLGFKNYAAYDLDDAMAKTVPTVEAFLNELTPKAACKQEREFVQWIADLPTGVTLTADGKIKPWDLAYIKERYRQKHLNLNDNVVSEYFPVDHVIQGIFNVYQRFLGLQFEPITCTDLWHPSVYCMAVRNRATQQLYGYLLLDLYPRPNKYSHACMMDIVAAQRVMGCDGKTKRNPAVIAILANFPQGNGTTPGLFKYSDVVTFFHEFGHAMHGMVGATRMYGFAGTATKTDFVEVPSQMFERWVSQEPVLKMLSKHYKTGESLPDKTIKVLGEIDRFDAGGHTMEMIGRSLLSLRLHMGQPIDIQELYTLIMSDFNGPYLAWDDTIHMPANFGHLANAGYASKYYSYLWSKVYAYDLFATVKQRGLLDPAVGQRLVDVILSKGGSVDPNILLRHYLGRKPNQDAFLKNLGL